MPSKHLNFRLLAVSVLTLLSLAVFLVAGIASAQDDDDTPQPFLGINLSEAENGVLVTGVAVGTPAEDAGLQVGDIITLVDDTAVTADNFVDVILGYAVGDDITLTVEREGEAIELTVTLGERPQSPGDNITFLGTAEVRYLADENVWEIVALDETNPLAEAGLQTGDRITLINGESPSPRDLMGVIPELIQGGDVTLTIERDGETLDIDVPVTALLSLVGGGFRGNFGGDNPGMPPIIVNPNGFQFGGPQVANRARLGVTFVTLDEQSAVEYETDVTEGAYITAVDTNSPADQAGLQEWDIITAVGGDMVDVERTLSDRLYAYEPGDIITLTVLRDGETLEIEVILGGREERADMMPFFGEGMFGIPFDFSIGIPLEQPQSPQTSSDL